MTEWMTRGQCGPWPLWLITIYVAANTAIFLAYFLLPLGLINAGKKGFHLGTTTQTTLWALFILFCGLGHLIENVGAFFAPNYYVFTGWHVVTALLSLYTALTFPIAVKASIQRYADLVKACRIT